MKKIIRIVKIICNVILTIFVLLFVLAVCLQRFSNNELSFLDYRMFTVVSGSMEPQYKIGDVLIAKETPPSKIKKSDVVTYLGTKGQFKDKVITHEVIEIEKTKDGKYRFHTKGKANLTEDPIVEEDQLYGVIVYKTVIISFIYGIIKKPAGMFILVIVPLLYIIFSEFTYMLIKKGRKAKERAQRANH